MLPRRWVVERTLARINRNRRLAKDFEKSITTAVAWIMIASVKLITRRLTRAKTTHAIKTRALTAGGRQHAGAQPPKAMATP